MNASKDIHTIIKQAIKALVNSHLQSESFDLYPVDTSFSVPAGQPRIHEIESSVWCSGGAVLLLIAFSLQLRQEA